MNMIFNEWMGKCGTGEGGNEFINCLNSESIINNKLINEWKKWDQWPGLI